MINKKILQVCSDCITENAGIPKAVHLFQKAMGGDILSFTHEDSNVDLADNIEHRLGIISFYFNDIHFNMVVKLLNDRFGVQVRGGCACAGTYGHYLLDVSHEKSNKITNLINHGDLSQKPGWVRLSLHPTMTNEELYIIIDALKQININHLEWAKDYVYDKHTNEFHHKIKSTASVERLKKWFSL